MLQDSSMFTLDHRDARSCLFKRANQHLRISICSTQLIRVSLSNDQPLPRRSWAVNRADDAWEPVEWSIVQNSDTTTLETTDVQVNVAHADGRITFTNRQQQAFFSDVAAATYNADGWLVTKQIYNSEHFYGFGERTGWLEKTGQHFLNWTLDPEPHHGPRIDNMYATMPVFMGLQPNLCYGVFFNTSFRSSVDVGATDAALLSLKTQGPDLDYYLVLGTTPADITAAWRELLGSMPLPAYWALGYHQSRWGYDSSSTMRAIADELRARNIPCDAIHFDIDYMDGYRVFTWHPERFDEPAQLVHDLAQDGFNVVTIIDPGVKTDPNYAVFAEGIANDYFIKRADGTLFSGYVWPDDSAFADFTRADVRAWWGNLHKTLVDAGVRGIWDDMNEPTVFDRPFSEGGGNGGTIDLNAPQGAADERTTHAEVHNLYGLLMAQATYEGLRQLRPNERPFVLTRSGFAGLSRWATLWTGDNSALWEHLEMTLPQICNLGLSGIPFVGVDIGGFFGNASPELWARWVQVGAFLPFCRGHSCSGTRPAEPWAFGERTEAIARAYLSLRYRLLPYLYTLFYQASTTGAPIIRPLVYEYPADLATHALHDQVLCGSQLLLAPIVRPGAEYRSVYLPAGEWYDWWTGERITGAQHILVHAPLERLPLYVRGGAILTLGPVLNYTGEAPLDPLTLDVYPSGTSEWTLYEDDGISFEYEQGLSATTHFSCIETAQSINLIIAARQGAWQPAPRTIVVNLHSLPPKAVLLDEQPLEWVHAEGAITLSFVDDGLMHSIKVEL